MSDKFFVGMGITASENNGKRKPISRVTLWLDDSNCLTAGDDTGAELQADCPHATQAMVDSILAQVKGYQYQAYNAEEANIDPSAELGDGVTVDGMYSVISRMDDDGSGYAGLSAPGEDELENEYPSAGPMTQEFNRQLAQTRSTISKTTEQIRLEVAGLEDTVSVTVDLLDGLTVTDSAGVVKIKGGMVTADGLHVNSANIDGTLKADQIELTGSISFQDLDASTQSTINNASTTASSAYGIAASANSNASSALNNLALLANGQYQGGTFIDGKNLYAPNLYGDTINLMDGSSYLVGSISLIPSATWAMDISSNLSLRMSAAGNVYMTNGNAWLQMVGSNLTLSGNVIVSSHNFGTALPASGTYGQVFFLIGG